MSSSTPSETVTRKQYSEKDFKERLHAMGDETEGKFERVCQWQGLPYARYGFNRPEFNSFETLPEIVRVTPDYVVEFGRKHYYVECKGSGRVVKIKQQSIDAMQHWGQILPVRFFVYNSVEDGYAFLSLEEIESKMFKYGTRKQFPDKKVYYEMPRSAFKFSKEYLNG